MPTYTNNTGKAVNIIRSDGSKKSMRPGSTVQTTYFQDPSLGLTEDDESPYYNSVVGSETVTGLSTTAQSVDIVAEARVVLVLNITGTVTVRRNVDTALPVLEDHTNEMVVVPVSVDGIPGRTKRLRLTGSGSCRIVQVRSMGDYLD